MEHFETLTNDDKNHFTLSDVIQLLQLTTVMIQTHLHAKLSISASAQAFRFKEPSETEIQGRNTLKS